MGIGDPVERGGVEIKISHIVNDIEVISVIVTVDAEHDSSRQLLRCPDDLLDLFTVFDTSFIFQCGMAAEDTGIR